MRRRSFELRHEIATLQPDHPDRSALERERMTAELAELRVDLQNMQQARNRLFAEFEKAFNGDRTGIGEKRQLYRNTEKHIWLICQELDRLEQALHIEHLEFA